MTRRFNPQLASIAQNDSWQVLLAGWATWAKAFRDPGASHRLWPGRLPLPKLIAIIWTQTRLRHAQFRTDDHNRLEPAEYFVRKALRTGRQDAWQSLDCTPENLQSNIGLLISQSRALWPEGQTWRRRDEFFDFLAQTPAFVNQELQSALVLSRSSADRLIKSLLKEGILSWGRYRGFSVYFSTALESELARAQAEILRQPR